jgi:hypothetical protein
MKETRHEIPDQKQQLGWEFDRHANYQAPPHVY